MKVWTQCAYSIAILVDIPVGVLVAYQWVLIVTGRLDRFAMTVDSDNYTGFAIRVGVVTAGILTADTECPKITFEFALNLYSANDTIHKSIRGYWR